MKRLASVLLLLLVSISCRYPKCPDCPKCPPNHNNGISTLGNTNYVEVTISGVTCFYLEKDVNGNQIKPMLLVLKDPSGKHKPILSLSGTDSAQLMDAINKPDCTTSACDMGNYRIRVTDDGAALTDPFKTSLQFDSYIVHLQTEANPAFTDFTTDAFYDETKPPTGGVWAVLDLHGGVVQTAVPFACQAHFDAQKCNTVDISMKPFASFVVVRFPVKKKPALEFLMVANTPKRVDFTGSNPQEIMLENKAPKVADSHMHLFRQLSKSNICLPEAISGSCSPGSDYVPGCGNSTYP